MADEASRKKSSPMPIISQVRLVAACLMRHLYAEQVTLTRLRFFGDIFFTLKDLRNAVAHNGVVVDVRFKSNSVNQGIGKLIDGDSNITGVNFNEIADYIVLLVYVLTKLQFAKADRTKFLNDFLAILKEYRASPPQPIFSKLVSSQAIRKVEEARMFSDEND